MELDPTALMAWVSTFMWPFMRVGAMFMAMPVIGTQNVPARVRMAITLSVTVIIASQLPDVPEFNPLNFQTWITIAAEILIGVAMGFALQLAFSSVIMAGQIIALQMGLGFASMVDHSSGMQMPVIAQLYLLAVILIFLSLNGHLLIIKMVLNSFTSLPIGGGFLRTETLWNLITWGADMFSAAVLIALPSIGALLIVNISFGIMTRASPQLNIFAVGFPFMVGTGLAVIWVTLPNLSSQVSTLFDQIFELVGSLIGVHNGPR
ncbi:MAG: flagellar biosynthetic protein FliR [Gammaproteobacteria bacterium]|nr:flagellar biosynthetic protein FliR [Gammaproteobacteria bacterium]